MYQNPVLNAPPGPDGLPTVVDPRKAQDDYEDFYEDVFETLAEHGELENVNVCDNLADHMVGNVYVKFREEESAAKAMAALQGRYYGGRPIVAEFSPVTDFREATCRQYEENTCNRGGYCNFMHLKPIGRDLRKQLFGRYRRKSRSRSRDRDRKEQPKDKRRRSRSRSRDRGAPDRRGRSPPRRGDDGGRGDRRGPIQRESSEERRAKIASWNKERVPGDGPPSGGYGGPPGQGGYGPPPPSYGAPPQYGGGGGGGGGYYPH